MDNMSSLGLGKTYLVAWSFVLLLGGCRSGPIDRLSTIALSIDPENSATLPEVPFAAGSRVEEILPLLIAEERVAIAARDLDGLAVLWDVNAQIIDQRGSEEPEDDYIWHGIGAILDRYEIAVFPFDPPPIEPPTGLVISCHVEQSAASATANESPANEPAANEPATNGLISNKATLPCLEHQDAANSTLSSVAENVVLDARNGGDLWSFVYRGGRWWIWRLKYN